MNGGDLRNAHALLVHGKQGPLASSNGPVAHLDIGWKNQVAFGPTTGFESLGWHKIEPQFSTCSVLKRTTSTNKTDDGIRAGRIRGNVGSLYTVTKVSRYSANEDK